VERILQSPNNGTDPQGDQISQISGDDDELLIAFWL